MVQIRNVPDKMHAELKSRAKQSGYTLTDYIQQIIERELARPPRDEVFARISDRTQVTLKKPAAAYVAEARREAS